MANKIDIRDLSKNLHFCMVWAIAQQIESQIKKHIDENNLMIIRDCKGGHSIDCVIDFEEFLDEYCYGDGSVSFKLFKPQSCAYQKIVEFSELEEGIKTVLINVSYQVADQICGLKLY